MSKPESTTTKPVERTPLKSITMQLLMGSLPNWRYNATKVEGNIVYGLIRSISPGSYWRLEIKPEAGEVTFGKYNLGDRNFSDNPIQLKYVTEMSVNTALDTVSFRSSSMDGVYIIYRGENKHTHIPLDGREKRTIVLEENQDSTATQPA